VAATTAAAAILLVSISPMFYKQLFHMKVFLCSFMCLQFGFVIFWQKDYGAKAAHKMLVKLTPWWRDEVGLQDDETS
jgi:hypothetical protein